MQIIRRTRSDPDFYQQLGPVFGSRKIERETRDRFYDDPGKIWFLVPDLGAASLLDGVIRNFWAANDEAAEGLLLSILAEAATARGIVPQAYRKAFEKMGFRTRPYQKNFLEVSHEKD